MALMSTVGMQWVVKNKGKTGISSIQGDLRNTTAMIRRMGTAALAAAGIGGLGYMLKQSMAAIDVVAKMSDELNLSTRAIKGLEHAAGIYGTKMENMHKGLQTFVRRLGEAKMGLGEARHGLEAMGISAEKIAAMGTEGAFMKVADHISQIEDATERAQIAYSMFGRQGVEMINLLMAGGDGLQKMVEEADKLGITFSRLDAAKVEAANDAMARLKQVSIGVAQTLAIELSPYIEAMADHFVDAATNGEGLGARMSVVFEGMAVGVVRVSSEVENLIAKFAQLASPASTASQAVNSVRAQQELKKYEAAMAAANNPRNRMFREQNLANAKLHLAAANKYSGNIASATSKHQPVNVGQRVSSVENAFASIRARQAELAGQYGTGASRSGSPGVGPWSGGYGYGPAGEAAGADYERVTASVSAARQETVKLNEAQQRTLQLSGSIANSFEDWLMNATSASDAVQAILDSIARMALRMGVTGPLEGAIQGGISKMYGSFNNSSYWGSTSGASGPGSGPPVGGYHGGGMYGEASFWRAGGGDWSRAPRYHTGIGPGEARAIIQKTEGVFTDGQMRAIGRGMTKGGAPSMNFKVINETGQPVEMEQGGMDFDFDEMVGSAIIRLHRQRGTVYDSTKQISKDAY